MRLPKFLREVVRKVQGKRQTKAEQTKLDDLVQEWKSQFEVDRKAKAEWDELFVEWEGIYNGDREFKNMGFSGQKSSREMRTHINFPRMIVERLIDFNVPKPDLKPVSADDEEAVDSLKNYIDYVVRASEPSLEEINLVDERRVKKFGGAFRKVHWNNNLKRAGYVGDIELSNPHPKDIVPNKGATGIQDMEHYHHCVNHTAREVVRKWNWITYDDLETKATYLDDLDVMDSDSAPYSTSPDNSTGFEARETGLKKYTIIETTYRDEEGDICKLWWTGDLLIKHVPKFFWHRDEDGKPTRMEILEAGTEIRRTKPDGSSEIVVLEEDTEVEYHIPTRWDIVYEPYIPRDKCFWGISLMEDIHDLNESIKKAVYQAEERRLRGNKKILVDNENDAKKIMDPTSEVIAITGTYHGSIDLGVSDDIQWIEKLKEWLQLLTGATNAAMGVEMPSVTSGKQASIYIEQANKKIVTSSAYKSSSYRQLYRVVADFAMAFADGERPYRLAGDREKEVYGQYNRLNMLKDKSGNIFYPDYDIEIGADSGFLQQKAEIMNVILQLADTGKLEASPGNLRILKILKRLGVPYLEDIITDMNEELQAIANAPPQQPTGQLGASQQPGAMPGMEQGQPPPGPMPGMPPPGGQMPPEQVLQMLPPEVQQAIMQMPPDQQAALLSLPPEQIMQMIQGQGAVGGGMQGGPPQGGLPPEIQQLIASLPPEVQQLVIQLPPEQQAQFLQLLQTDPQQALAILRQMATGAKA